MLIEIAIGMFLGLVGGTRLGWDPSSSLVLGVLLSVVVYFLSCWGWPNRPCPLRWRTSHQPKASGPGKAYRRRRPCKLCGGSDYVRLGARLIGRG